MQSNQVIQDEELRHQLKQCFYDQDFENIVTFLEHDHYYVYYVHKLILKALKSHKIEIEMKVFAMDLATHIISMFGIPAILMWNNEECYEILKEILLSGLEEEVIEFLKKSIGAFSFDKERLTIGYLAELWKDLVEDMDYFPSRNVKVTPFIEVFCDIQSILLSFEDEYQQSLEDKEYLLLRIQETISEDIFKKVKLKPLEYELIQRYIDDLFDIQVLIKDQIRQLKKQHKGYKVSNNKQQMSYGVDKQADKAVLGIDKGMLQSVDKLFDRDPKKRMYFLLNEKLGADESDSIEYKSYYFPFSDQIEKTLKKTICAFLNRRGGRIFIGIDDSQIVKGIKLTIKQRDQLKLKIHQLLRDFEPDVVNHELINVIFMPIYNPVSNMKLAGRFVVKILVKQGDPSKLYSISKSSLLCYVRNDGQSSLLTARETTDLIIKRHNQSQNKIPETEFDDPEPHSLLDEHEERMNTKKSNGKVRFQDGNDGSYEEQEQQGYYAGRTYQQQQQQSGGGRPKRGKGWKFQFGLNEQEEIYEVFIDGLPVGMPIHDFKSLLSRTRFQSIVYYRMFKNREGGCNGRAFVNFADLNEAKDFIRAMDGLKIGKGTVKAEFKK